MAKHIGHPPADFAKVVAGMRTDLRVAKAEFRPVSTTRTGRAEATSRFHADLRLTGLGPFAYDGTVVWRRVDGGGRIIWPPATLHPQLGPGLHFATTRPLPVRAAILGSDGQPLVSQTDLVAVGLEPDRIPDRQGLNAAFQQVLQIPAATI